MASSVYLTPRTTPCAWVGAAFCRHRQRWDGIRRNDCVYRGCAVLIGCVCVRAVGRRGRLTLVSSSIGGEWICWQNLGLIQTKFTIDLLLIKIHSGVAIVQFSCGHVHIASTNIFHCCHHQRPSRSALSPPNSGYHPRSASPAAQHTAISYE